MTPEIDSVPRVAVEAADVIVSGAAMAATQSPAPEAELSETKTASVLLCPETRHRYREEVGGDELEEII